MKIRKGFVSNSSSSSFCILGVQRDCGSLKGTDLESHSGIGEYCEDDRFVGLPPTDMKDSETLLEFKNRVVAQLASVGIEARAENLNWYIDGGYNG
jgi:hypothetical protein